MQRKKHEIAKVAALVSDALSKTRKVLETLGEEEIKSKILLIQAIDDLSRAQAKLVELGDAGLARLGGKKQG